MIKLKEEILRRTYILYVAGALMGTFFIDSRAAAIDYLNYLKGVEGYLRHYALGKEAFDSQRFKEGLRYYKNLMKIMPQNYYAKANLGYCYFQLGDYARAKTYYQMANSTDKSNYAFHFDLGMLAYRDKDYSSAAQDLTSCLSLIPMAEDYFWKTAKKAALEGKKNILNDIVEQGKRIKEDEQTANLFLSRARALETLSADGKDTFGKEARVHWYSANFAF